MEKAYHSPPFAVFEYVFLNCVDTVVCFIFFPANFTSLLMSSADAVGTEAVNC